MNYLYRFIAYEINDRRDIFIGTTAFFVRLEFHKEISIFKCWIGYGGAIVFKSFFHIHFSLVVHANGTVWWAHFIVTV